MKQFYALLNHCHLNHLSYVIGVILGDASVYESHHTNIHPITGKLVSTYTIELCVKDKPFAQEFAQRLDLILHRPESRRWKVLRDTRRERLYWRVCVRSRSFGIWWKSLKTKHLRELILSHPADFLRGIYDSEGNLTDVIRIFTTDKAIVELVTDAVNAMGLQTHTRLFRPKGSQVTSSVYTGLSKKDLFVIHVKPRQEFLSKVGSSIPRKAQYRPK